MPDRHWTGRNNNDPSLTLPCVEEELCYRAFGTRSEDVADFGNVPPCQQRGWVRCVVQHQQKSTAGTSPGYFVYRTYQAENQPSAPSVPHPHRSFDQSNTKRPEVRQAHQKPVRLSQQPIFTMEQSFPSGPPNQTPIGSNSQSQKPIQPSTSRAETVHRSFQPSVTSVQLPSRPRDAEQQKSPVQSSFPPVPTTQRPSQPLELRDQSSLPIHQPFPPAQQHRSPESERPASQPPRPSPQLSMASVQHGFPPIQDSDKLSQVQSSVKPGLPSVPPGTSPTESIERNAQMLPSSQQSSAIPIQQVFPSQVANIQRIPPVQQSFPSFEAPLQRIQEIHLNGPPRSPQGSLQAVRVDNQPTGVPTQRALPPSGVSERHNVLVQPPSRRQPSGQPSQQPSRLPQTSGNPMQQSSLSRESVQQQTPSTTRPSRQQAPESFQQFFPPTRTDQQPASSIPQSTAQQSTHSSQSSLSIRQFGETGEASFSSVDLAQPSFEPVRSVQQLDGSMSQISPTLNQQAVESLQRSIDPSRMRQPGPERLIPQQSVESIAPSSQLDQDTVQQLLAVIRALNPSLTDPDTTGSNVLALTPIGSLPLEMVLQK